MYYSVIDSDFNIQDIYSTARKVLKKVLVKIGEMTFVFFISTGVGYAQKQLDQPLYSQQTLVEVVSNVHSTSVTFDVNNGQLVAYDKTLIPELQYRRLMRSLLDHKGGKMSSDFLHSFEDLAHYLAILPFRESLARFSVVNDFVNINLVFDMGVELELTQFPAVDEVAFSIHHDGTTLAVATAKGDVLAEKMHRILNQSKLADGIS